MTQTSQRTSVIPLTIGPAYSAGDPSTLPDGFARTLINYMIRPNRFDGRPPFVYDGLMSVASFLRWEDTSSQVTRTIAVDTGQHLRTKNTNGTGYTATVVNGEPTGRLSDYANFLGKVYQMYDDGSGTPAGASVWDGTTLSTSPFNSVIVSRTITAFIERLFLASPRVSVTNMLYSPNLNYSVANAFTGQWVGTNVTPKNITLDANTVIGRLSATSTAASACSAITGGSAGIAIANTVKNLVWRSDLRGVEAAFDVPITLEVLINSAPITTHAYNVGDLMTSGGYRYRVTVAGTSAGAAPVYGTTIGGTTADGGVTWLNEGTDVIGSIEDTVLNVTAVPTFTPYFVSTSVPTFTNTTVLINLRIKFYNTSTPALTMPASIDLSSRDGKTDGDPAKQNYGQQLTLGDFLFPFNNIELSATATVNLDAIVWSEIQQPKRILAKNTFALTEVAGLPTAATVVGGRYIVFKRRGFWIFKRQTDKNNPILPERPANIEIGCIGSRALDVFGDTIYFIGEYGIYRMKASSSVYAQVEDPEEIGGPGMREEIMARGSGWVETQLIYNVPFLVVEHQNQEVWVYTQKGKIYVYHIPTSGWSTIEIYDAASATYPVASNLLPDVASIFYDFGGNRMNVAIGGHGAVRFDETSSAKDTINNTASALAIENVLIPKAVELFAPRYEAALDEVGLFHLATAAQTGQTLSAAFSLNRGSSWTTPAGYPATVDITQPRVPLPIGTLGPSVMVKLSRVGFGGAANWSISKADTKLRILRGELPYANATT